MLDIGESKSGNVEPKAQATASDLGDDAIAEIRVANAT